MTRTSTEDMIAALAAEARPVRRLLHPLLRALIWVVLTFGFVAVMVVAIGPRPDLPVKLTEPRFQIEIAAALLTSMMAAAAAFCSGCPGRPAWERYAPLPFLVIWLAALGEGCWRDLTYPATTRVFGIDLDCVEIVFLLSLVPAILIFVMIRRGAPLTPMLTAGLATLAATAAAAAGLRFFHMQDMSLMLLVWQFGVVLLLSLAGALIGKLVLRWRPRRVVEIKAC